MNYVKTLPSLGYSLVVLTGKPSLRETDPETTYSVPSEVAVNRAMSVEDYFLDILSRTGLASVEDVTAVGLGGMGRGGFRSTILRVLKAAKPLPNHVSGWALPAVRTGRSLLNDVDCIVSRSNPVTSHLVALKLRRLSNLPWVACFSDPWTVDPDPPHLGRLLPPVLVDGLSAHLEMRVVYWADAIVLTTEDQRRLYVNRYPQLTTKFVVIPNCYSPVESDQPRRVGSRETGSGGSRTRPFTIVYTGSLHRRRSPESFFKALSLLRETDPGLYKDLKVVLIGEVTSSAGLVLDYDIGDVVELKPPISRLDALRWCSSADLLLLLDAQSDGRNVFLPSKLLDYMAVGRPVLALTPEGSSADVVRSTRIGTVVSTYVPEDIAKEVRYHYNEHKHGVSLLKRDPKEIEKYSADACAKKLAALVESLRRRGVPRSL